MKDEPEDREPAVGITIRLSAATADAVLVFVRHLLWLAALSLSVTGVLILIWFGGAVFGAQVFLTGLLCFALCLLISMWRNIRAHGFPFPKDL